MVRGEVVQTPVLDFMFRYAHHGGERWHTPGHKGRSPKHGGFLEWTYDITEVGEMLSAPNPLTKSEALMAETFGADRTWYSVGGATIPVMAAILAAVPFGSEVWVDRALHRSVLGALVIGGYRVHWLYPDWLRAGLALPLTEFPATMAGATGLLVTRPTYDGLTGNLSRAIQTAHEQNLVVVVDEAHGSHWRGAAYPPSALALGADLVAHGVHKSEAALTQTGLLHLQGTRVSRGDVDRWFRVLQTSSPSYLLLASLDRLQWERHQLGMNQAWDQLADQARQLWMHLESRGLAVLQSWAEHRGLIVDPSRLTLMGPGQRLNQVLSRGGVVEKWTAGSVTLLLSPGQSLDRIYELADDLRVVAGQADFSLMSYPRLGTFMDVRQAWNTPGEWVLLDQAAHRVLKDGLTPYPPGIPLAMPGEALTQEAIDWLLEWLGLECGIVEGVQDEGGRPCVWVTND